MKSGNWMIPAHSAQRTLVKDQDFKFNCSNFKPKQSNQDTSQKKCCQKRSHAAETLYRVNDNIARVCLWPFHDFKRSIEENIGEKKIRKLRKLTQVKSQNCKKNEKYLKKNIFKRN